MPRETTITRESVFQACDAMAADGQRPTVASILKMTGGSIKYVNQYVTEWKQQHIAEKSPPPEYLCKAWEKAESEAREKAEAIVRERYAELEASYQFALGDNEQKERALSDARDTNKILAQENDSLSHSLSASKEKIQELKNEIIALKEAYEGKLEREQQKLIASEKRESHAQGELMAAQAKIKALLDNEASAKAATKKKARKVPQQPKKASKVTASHLHFHSKSDTSDN